MGHHMALPCTIYSLRQGQGRVYVVKLSGKHLWVATRYSVIGIWVIRSALKCPGTLPTTQVGTVLAAPCKVVNRVFGGLTAMFESHLRVGDLIYQRTFQH